MRVIGTAVVAGSIYLNGISTSITNLNSILLTNEVNTIEVVKQPTMRDYQELSTKGIFDLTSGNFEPALKEFNDALEIYKQVKNTDDDADLYLSRGITYEKLERWNDAITDYQKANEIFKSKSLFKKDDPVAISNIANAKTGLKLWEEALNDFTYASKLNPKYLAPAIGKALVQYELNNKEQSQEFFKQLIITYPDYADGLAVLAVMYYIQGDMNLALTSWEDALEEDSRYLDIDWVANIRRWPPSLVRDLQSFRQAMKQQQQ